MQRPVNKTSREFSRNKRLPGRYSYAAAARFDYRLRSFSFFFVYQHESGVYYDTGNLLPAADKNIYNSGVRYRGGNLLLSAGVNNIGDSTYEDFNGFPQAGRNWLVTAEYFF